MIPGRWFITPHAVARYRERIRRCSYAEALGDLVALSDRAHLVRVDADGMEHWRGPRPLRLRFRVLPGTGPKGQLVTVLRGCDA